MINLGFNGTSNQTITANNSTGVLRFTSAFTSNTGTSGKLILAGTGAGQIDQGLPQLPTGGLEKTGAGTWTLGGSGNFTGPTLITAGTLSLSSSTALQNSPFNTASVAGSASAGLKIATSSPTLGGLTGSNSFESRFNTTSSVLYDDLTALTLNTATSSAWTYSGGLADNGLGMTLTKNGAGTQYLSGTMGYTGATTVNGGFLGSNSTFSGPVTVAKDAGLAPGASAGAFGTFTISNASASALTLNGSNLLMDISTATNDLIAVTGTAVLNGNNTVLPNMTTGVAAGTYSLVTYAAKTGSGSAVFANGTTTLGNATLAVNAGNIQMTVGAGGLDSSVWKGTTGTWDSGTNWTRNGTANQAFVAGDWVTIDDTGSNAATITSAGTVSPTSLLVNTTTKNFTISATIGGSAPVTKLGAGTLTLSGTNSYTGGTFIGGGRVGITSNANLGDAAGTITFNGGELYITNDFSSARNVILNGTGNQVLLQGNGDWTNSGAFTGDGGITFRQNPNGGTSATLTSLSNDFKGPLGIEYGNGGMLVKIRSMVDSATADGNIIFGIGSTANTGGAGQIFEWMSTAGSALTLDNRAVEFGRNGSAWGTIKNSHVTNAITINTDLAVSGTGAKTLVLEAVAGPSNIFDGDISDGGGTVTLRKEGAGSWTLSGENTHTGTTSNIAGILVLGDALALQNSALDTVASKSGSSTEGLRTTATTLTLGGLTGNKNFASTGGVFSTTSGGYGSVTALTLNPGSNVTHSYSGAIANGASGMTLSKAGAGTQILAGTNTYTGATTVNSGTLLINGSLAAGSAVTVENSAVLGGNGTINGTVSIEDTATLAPGTSIGMLTINNNLTLGATSVYSYELTSGSSTADLTDVSGNLDLGGSTLTLVQLGTYAVSEKFTLFAYDGTLAGTFASLADGGTFTAAGGLWQIDYDDSIAGLNGGAGNKYVTISAVVPEPTTLGLLGLGAVGLMRRRRVA